MTLTEDPAKARHWRYFLLLEGALDRALQVVEPDPVNFGAFGLDLARQLVATCAQFEVVTRLLCSQEVPSLPTNNIDQIYTALHSFQPNLASAHATVLWRPEKILPFEHWTKRRPPTWWTAYNKVKHDPARQIASAALGNLLSSCAALGLVTREYVGDNAIHRNRVFWLEWPLP